MLKFFLNYIETHFSHHSHQAIALKSIDLLDYVDKHLDEVAQQALEKSLFRHPESHLALHLNGYHSPELAKEELKRFISEVKGCLDALLAIDNEDLKKVVIHLFLSNINDSPVGCLEVRFRQALTFAGLFLSNGVLSINDLMQQYYETTNMDGQSTAALLDFFADQIEHRIPIRHLDGKVAPLSWEEVKCYMQQTLGYAQVHEDWEAFGQQQGPQAVLLRDYYFKDERQAKRYLAYLKSILPKEYEQELAKARVKSEQGQYYFTLKKTNTMRCSVGFIPPRRISPSLSTKTNGSFIALLATKQPLLRSMKLKIAYKMFILKY